MLAISCTRGCYLCKPVAHCSVDNRKYKSATQEKLHSNNIAGFQKV